MASWKEIQITLPDFTRSYYQYWQIAGLSDSPDLRRFYAQRLIEQEIIADMGLRMGFDTLSSISRQLEIDLEKFCRRRYLETVIKDSLTSPSESEVQSALKYQTMKIYLRQLYTPVYEKLNPAQNLLKSGQTFDLIYERTAAGEFPGVSASHLGWTEYGMMDLPVEETVFSMKSGQVSQPMESLMGWHIFRLDSVRTTMHLSSAGILSAELIKRQLLERKFDLAIARHIRGILWQKELLVDVRAMRRLWEHIEPFTRHTSPDNIPAEGGYSSEIPPPQGENFIVATVDGEPYTANEFFRELPMIPKEYLQPNLKKAIELTIRDKILTQLAAERGLCQDAVVQEKLRRQKMTYVYYKTLSAIPLAHLMDESSVREYYETHKEKYVQSSQTEVYEIVVSDQDTARYIADLIQKGFDFSELYARFSDQKHDGTRQGYLGYVDDDTQPYGKLAASLKTGDIYAPVKLAQGFAVIRIGQKRYHYKEFEDVKEDIVKDIGADRWEQTHRFLLPKDYSADQIRLNENALQKALRTHEVIF